MSYTALPTRSRSATSWISSSPRIFRRNVDFDLTQSLELIFEHGRREGLIDRPIEIVYRGVMLPKGSAKAVIDAYGGLVDEGYLRRLAPFITDDLRADAGGGRAALRSAGDQRHRMPKLVRTVDVRSADGITHRQPSIRLGG